jgi:hypothetical protein
MLSDEERADRKMSEKTLQGRVMYRAKRDGWKIMHIPRGQAGGGQWRSTTGGGKGFPDLVLVRDRVLFVELKKELNHPDEDQVAWLEALNAARVETYVWRPSDLRLGIVDAALAR